MASGKNYVRDYSAGGEGAYDSSPARMEANRKRKAARYAMEQAGKVKRNDGKDVDHKDSNPSNNNPKNLRVLSRAANRSLKRNKNAGEA